MELLLKLMYIKEGKTQGIHKIGREREEGEFFPLFLLD
jgi:hypothetical protein